MEIISGRTENEQRSKISEYIALLSIIHAEKPEKLLKKFRNMLETEEAFDDDIGDLEGLERLKEKMRGGRYGG